MTTGKVYDRINGQSQDGSLVKRLRHGPLKAETGVRFSHESPKKGHPITGVFFCASRRIELHRWRLRRSYIRLTASSIASQCYSAIAEWYSLRELRGEYNTTVSGANNITLPHGNITRRARRGISLHTPHYNFNYSCFFCAHMLK